MLGVVKWQNYAVVALVLIASHGASYGYGRLDGGRAAEARHAADQLRTQRELFRVAEDLSLRALDLDRAMDAQRTRAMEAEDAARANPDVCRLPAPDSLHRLDRRWTSP